MWHCKLFLLLVPLWTLTAVVASPHANGFSLAVNPKADASRNFVRDWAAARHKWGKGVPREIASAFALSDSRESFSDLTVSMRWELTLCSWHCRCRTHGKRRYLRSRCADWKPPTDLETGPGYWIFRLVS